MKTAYIDKSHPHYPTTLLQIQRPPEGLHVAGNSEILNNKSVAIVGTRKATQNGFETAEKLAYELGKRGFCIVSGLAFGIDSAAHRGALNAGAKTIAVLGCGIDKIYPAANKNLADDILASRNAIISEYEQRSTTFPSNFIERNRIVAGLSIATIIIEAPLRSGAINTAGWAAEQGKTVLVMPGPTAHPNYAGNHGLIRDGATLVASLAHILEDLGVGDIEIEESPQDMPTDEAEIEILDTLEHASEPMSVDEVIEETGLDPHEVSPALVSLAIRGLIRESGGLYEYLSK